MTGCDPSRRKIFKTDDQARLGEVYIVAVDPRTR
jgi:hypothetical protein